MGQTRSIAKRRIKSPGSVIAVNETDLYENEYKFTQRVLLIGVGSSGKSTLFSQAVHHQHGCQEEVCTACLGNSVELHAKSVRIYVLKSLLKFLQQSDLNIGETETLIEQSISALRAPGARLTDLPIQSILEAGNIISNSDRQESRSSDPQLDHLPYFLTRLKDIFQECYQPTRADFLRAKSRSTGISSVMLTIKFPLLTVGFTLVDAGGEKSERRKWRSLLPDADFVHFFASTLDFLDNSPECLSVFEEYVTKMHTKDHQLFILLTKTDLVEKYVGDDLQSFIQGIKDKFQDVASRAGATINYIDSVNLLDPKDLEMVMGKHKEKLKKWSEKL